MSDLTRTKVALGVRLPDGMNPKRPPLVGGRRHGVASMA